MKFTYLLLSICLLLSSCSEEKPLSMSNLCDTVDCGEGICLNGICDCPEGFLGTNCEKRRLKTSEQNGAITNEFTYTVENNLLQHKVFSISGTLNSQIDYEVLGDTLLVTTSQPPSNVIFYNKYFLITPNEIGKITLNPNQELLSFFIYEFSTDCGIMRIEDQNSGTITVYEILENNCDYRKTRTSSNGTLLDVQMVKGDGMKNSRIIALEYFIDFNIGNPATNEMYDLFNDPTGNTINENNSYTSVFIYNEQGYPLTEVRTYYDGDNDSLVYTYY